MNTLHSKFETERFALEQILHSLEILPSVLISLIGQFASSSILIVVGGNNINNGQCNIPDCEFFNFSKKRWEFFSTLPKPQWGAFLLQVKHKLFLIGGCESAGGSGTRSCYECNLLTIDFPWKKRKHMSKRRILPFGFCYQNEIYIFGGYTFYRDEEICHRTGERYNLLTNTWTYLSSLLPSKEFYLALAMVISKKDTPSVYAFAEKNPLKFFATYNIHTDMWNLNNLSELQKEEFKSLEIVSYHSSLGMYFNYPYIYIAESGKIKKYNIFEKIGKMFTTSFRSSYYTMLVPNKYDLFPHEEMLLFDWNGEMEIIHCQTQSLRSFSSLHQARSRCACRWIELE